MRRITYAVFGLFVITSMILGACRAATPTEEPPAPTDTEAPMEEPTEEPMEEPTEEPVEEPTEEPMMEFGSVKLGALIPLTGPLAEFGEGFRQAGDLAVKHLTEAGFPTEVVYADTETSAIPGVEAARNLVEVERVVALIGAAASGVTIPVAESVAIPNEIPQISNASTSPLISLLPADEGQDFLFRTAPSDALQGVALAMLAEDQGYARVAVLFVNNAYGQGLTDQFQYSFELRGGEVTATVSHDEAPAPTYVSELRQVMEGEPDAVVALAYPGHATVYLKEFIEAGYSETTDLLFVDGTKSQEMPTEIGAELLAGYVGTAPAASEAASPDVFKDAYAAEYGEAPPLPFMENFYDAIVVARLAAAAAQAEGMEIDGVAVRDHLRVAANAPGEKIGPGTESLTLAYELLATGGEIDYDGAVGVDFDDVGDVVSPIEYWQYVAEDPFIERIKLVTDIPPEPVPAEE